MFMKRLIACVSLALAIAASFLLFGCASSTSTDTTTTTATTTTLGAGAAAGSAAYDAVTAVVGISGTSTSIGGMTGVKPTALSASAVRSFANPTPPDAFFSPIPSSGWITIEGAGMVSGETLQVRMYTKGGQVVSGTFLSSKKIATFEGYSWRSLITPPSGGAPTDFFTAIYLWLTHSPTWESVPGSTATAADFYASVAKYQPLSTFWDYIIWAHVGPNPSSEVAMRPAYTFYPGYNFPAGPVRPDLASYPRFVTPESTSSDHIGSQEAHVTGTHPDGSTIDMTNTVSTDADGKPVSATGSGTIVRPGGVTLTIVNTMNFTDGSPSGGTMDLTAGPPDNLHVVMTMTATGAATGTVYSTATSPETEIGSLVIYGGTDASGHHGYFEDKATGTKNYF
jgi:hypothetical protein